MGKCRSKRWQKENRMGGLYSRSWHQEGLGTNPAQFVPYQCPTGTQKAACAPWYTSTPSLLCFRAFSLPGTALLGPRARSPLLTPPWLARRVQERGWEESTQYPRGKKTLPCHLWDCRFSWCQRSERWGGKPHLFLPLPLPPALHFSLSHFKNCPSIPPHPQKYTLD